MSIEGQPSKLSTLMVNRGDSVTKITRTATLTSQTLKVYEQVVLIDNGTTGGTFTLTLPPVGEAAGKTYAMTLIAKTGDDAYIVTIQDQDDSIDWDDFKTTMNRQYDSVLLFSDGMKWWPVVTDLGNTEA